MLIIKICVRKFIHILTNITTFDCRDNYSDTQQSTTCKIGECSKTKKSMWSTRDCICSNFCHKNHLLNVSLKRKTDISIIIRRITTEKKRKSRWYKSTTARFWYSTIKLFSSENVYKSQSPTDKCRSLRLTKLNSSFPGRESFWTPAFNDRGPMQTGNDTYCCSRPTALALSAVVIRRMMVEMVSVFLFSETFNK